MSEYVIQRGNETFPIGSDPDRALSAWRLHKKTDRCKPCDQWIRIDEDATTHVLGWVPRQGTKAEANKMARPGNARRRAERAWKEAAVIRCGKEER